MSKLLYIMLAMSIFLSGCHRYTMEEQCDQMVKREKRRLPRNIIRGLVLDSMKYDRHTHTLVYFHTLNDSIYSPELMDQSKADVGYQLQQEISNSVALKRLKDEGLSFSYVYHAKSSGRKIMELSFDNADLR